MSLRDRNKADRRARIEAAARDLFATRGFEAATIREIASSAGVSSGTVLNYFESKVGLLYELFHSDLEAVVSARWATLPREAPLVDQLAHVFSGFLELYAENQGLARVYVRESLSLPPAQLARYDGLNAAFAGRLAGLIRERAGELRSEVNPDFLALMAFTLYLHAAADLIARPEPSAARATAACRAYLTAMLAPLWVEPLDR
jgi:TetR/AcrR family transcriptional regulator, cholesterol catabolism regulator